jgi:transposase
MPKKLQLRAISANEKQELERISRSRSEAARRVERAKIVLALGMKERVAEIAKRYQRSLPMIYQVLHRFNVAGLAALDDAPKSGRPQTYSEDQRGELLAVAQTHPQQLGLSFGHWTLDRLVHYAHEQLTITISRSQLGLILQQEGLRWYQEKTYFTERPDPQFAEKRGP